MKKNATYNVTEWEWLEIQLKLYSLYIRSEIYSVLYEFDFYKEGEIVCAIYAKQIQEMVENKSDKKEQLEYYYDWVRAEKNYFSKTLEKLPALKNEFDIEKDIKFEIRYDYGMGASTVCEIIGDTITWEE